MDEEWNWRLRETSLTLSLMLMLLLLLSLMLLLFDASQPTPQESFHRSNSLLLRGTVPAGSDTKPLPRARSRVSTCASYLDHHTTDNMNPSKGSVSDSALVSTWAAGRRRETQELVCRVRDTEFIDSRRDKTKPHHIKSNHKRFIIKYASTSHLFRVVNLLYDFSSPLSSSVTSEDEVSCLSRKRQS